MELNDQDDLNEALLGNPQSDENLEGQDGILQQGIFDQYPNVISKEKGDQLEKSEKKEKKYINKEQIYSLQPEDLKQQYPSNNTIFRTVICYSCKVHNQIPKYCEQFLCGNCRVANSLVNIKTQGKFICGACKRLVFYQMGVSDFIRCDCGVVNFIKNVTSPGYTVIQQPMQNIFQQSIMEQAKKIAQSQEKLEVKQKKQQIKKEENIKDIDDIKVDEDDEDLRVSGLMLYVQSDESFENEIKQLDKQLEKEKQTQNQEQQK